MASWRPECGMMGDITKISKSLTTLSHAKPCLTWQKQLHGNCYKARPAHSQFRVASSIWRNIRLTHHHYPELMARSGTAPRSADTSPSGLKSVINLGTLQSSIVSSRSFEFSTSFLISSFATSLKIWFLKLRLSNLKSTQFERLVIMQVQWFLLNRRH